MTPTERTARARLAAHARWANDPDRIQPKAAHEASPASVGYWLAKVDSRLAPDVRRKVAISKRNEHMARLAFRRARRAS